MPSGILAKCCCGSAVGCGATLSHPNLSSVAVTFVNIQVACGLPNINGTHVLNFTGFTDSGFGCYFQKVIAGFVPALACADIQLAKDLFITLSLKTFPTGSPNTGLAVMYAGAHEPGTTNPDGTGQLATPYKALYTSGIVTVPQGVSVIPMPSILTWDVLGPHCCVPGVNGGAPHIDWGRFGSATVNL